MIDFVENISIATDKNQHTLGIFIDLHKAFDTTDQLLLLQKLKYYDIGDEVI